jgi:hypothetical protein
MTISFEKREQLKAGLTQISDPRQRQQPEGWLPRRVKKTSSPIS